MPRLVDVMVNNPHLLNAMYREPLITAYNRLEGRPRTDDFSRSLRAEIRDALWFVTRQWQLGELEAQDAGSPVDARLLTRRLPIDRVAIGDAPPGPYDDSLPLEVVVERETIPWTLLLKIESGQQFIRLHDTALKSKYADIYRSRYGLDVGQDTVLANQGDALALYVAAGRRAIDGEKVLVALDAGTFAGAVGIEAADLPAITQIADTLRTWLRRLYSQPDAGSPNAWEPDRLCYRVTIASPSVGDEQAVLSASHYREGRLDWFAFDAVARSDTALDGATGTFATEVISFLPTAATFPGLPQPRFWKFEDGQINFGSINAKTTDHLLLAFAEMALIYGNDWFVIPYKVSVNTLTEIRGLVVTDVFGDRHLIKPANEADDTNWQRWSMFNVTGQDGDGWWGRYFFLPASVLQAQESMPIEMVNFVRDEMANLVWAVEETIPDALGRGLEARLVVPPVARPPVLGAFPVSVRYLLGTTVPENWVPFIPVHLPGSIQDIRFQRGSMPKLGDSGREVVKPRGVLLNEIPAEFYVAEEEVPASGLLVTRRYQRTRWYDGRTYLWVGRACETGRGGGSSGLRFDQIEDL